MTKLLVLVDSELFFSYEELLDSSDEEDEVSGKGIKDEVSGKRMKDGVSGRRMKERRQSAPSKSAAEAGKAWIQEGGGEPVNFMDPVAIKSVIGKL